MLRRLGMATATLLVLTAPMLAQEEFAVSVNDRNLVTDMRDGKTPVNDAAREEKKRAIEAVARFAMLRITSEVNRGLKSGRPTPMTVLHEEASRYVLIVPQPPRKISESQREYSQAYGKACVALLRPIFGTKEKASKFEPLVRVNAARLLAQLGLSGHEGCIDLAVDLIEAPKETDAVRFYALQALKNVFSAVNPEDASRSPVTNADTELRGIQALITFVNRKSPLSVDASAEEVEALRYVRREAIRALGSVRKPIIRKDKAVLAIPAVWLLRIACADPVITLTPSVAERAEALIGYLQLNPDRQQNIDYAIFFLAKTARDLATEFNSRTTTLPALDPKVPPPMGVSITQRDYYTWKLFAARLEGALKDWKTAWDNEHPNTPQPAARLVNDFVNNVTENVCKPLQSNMMGGNTADPASVNNWINSQFEQKIITSPCLFNEDPKALVVHPNV